jgi:hypothetical protein
MRFAGYLDGVGEVGSSGVALPLRSVSDEGEFLDEGEVLTLHGKDLALHKEVSTTDYFEPQEIPKQQHRQDHLHHQKVLRKPVTYQTTCTINTMR